MTEQTATDHRPQTLAPLTMPAQRTRPDKWLRALGIIALIEAIILMTAALILGFLVVVAGANLLNSVNDATQTPASAPDVSGSAYDPPVGAPPLPADTASESTWKTFYKAAEGWCAKHPDDPGAAEYCGMWGTTANTSSIDPNAGDYTDADLRDYKKSPGQFCFAMPKHVLCQ